MHRRSRRGWVWILVSLFILILAAGGIGFAASRAPVLADQITYNQRDLKVSFRSPEEGSAWPADAFIPVDVTVQGAAKLARVELWANSRLVAAAPPPAIAGPGEYNVRLTFQPGLAGKFFLTTVGVTTSGAQATSGVRFITATAAVGSVEPQNSQEGDTLAVIAQRFKLGVDRLKLANPELDPAKTLPVNTVVKIPHEPLLQGGGQNGSQSSDPLAGLPRPLPLQNSPVALPDLPGQSADLPGQPIEVKDPADLQKLIQDGLSSGGDPAAPAENSPLQNLWVQIQGAIPALQPAGVPKAPYLWMYHTTLVDSTKCMAYITFIDHSDNEEGFFVYRAPAEGGEFERIATLPAAHKPAGSSVEYQDSTGYGDMTYLISAFNGAGENRSQPVTLEFDAHCPVPASTDGIQISGNVNFQNGVLSVPADADLAYLYVKIADLPWERIPDQGKFLSGTGSFDLNDYLESKLELFRDTDFEVTYEVWGWVHKKVQKLGTVHQTIHRSTLMVCSKIYGECAGSGPQSGWVTDLELPDDIPFPQNLELKFKWDTGITQKIKNAQISVNGVNGSAGYLGSQSYFISAWTEDWTSGDDKTFRYKPAQEFWDPSQSFSLGKWDYGYYTYTSNWFMKDAPPGAPFILMLDVNFKTTNNSDLPSTNKVTLRYRNQKPAPPAVTLAPEIPSLYALKFIDYTPPLLPRDEDWGCVIITNNTQWASAGQRICPSDYEPPSDWEMLVDGIAGMIESAFNWISDAISSAKDWVVDQVASVLGCTGTCRDLLMAGLNYGITALTGLPPTLPNFDEMASVGIEYVVQVTAEEMGVTYCPDEVCRSAIRASLQQAVASARSQAAPPGCVSDDEAHARGKNPLCLPPEVTWRPTLHSIYRPATIKLQVTRRADTAAANLTQADARKYAVQITVPGSNDTRIGDWFPICGFNEDPQGPETGYTDPGGAYALKRQINEPLAGDLYTSQVLEIPWLQPGQSITIPVPLERARFLRLNHEYDWHNADVDVEKCIQSCGDDWPYLYFDGISLFKAEEICLNPQGQRVSCGAKTELKITNPPANAFDVEPPVAVPAE